MRSLLSSWREVQLKNGFLASGGYEKGGEQQLLTIAEEFHWTRNKPTLPAYSKEEREAGSEYPEKGLLNTEG